MDTKRNEEPPDGDERSVVLGWLAFHRDVLAAKCAGLDAHQLTTRASPPSTLTLLGLVRHLTEMERVYLVYALGPAGRLEFVYGDYEEGGPSGTSTSTSRWSTSRSPDGSGSSRRRRVPRPVSVDRLAGTGNRRSVRWNLQKLVGEYARHNGHADLLRERIDGATGE